MATDICNLNTKSWANQVKGCVLRLLQLLFFCYEYITLVALTILPAGYRGQIVPW